MSTTTSLSPGKDRRLRRLSDPEGRFAMLAVDQRGSLRRMIGRRDEVPPDTVTAEALRQIKRVVTEAIAPLATGLLTDPLYGYPASRDVLPPAVGLLLSGEATGYASAEDGERRSRLIDGFSPEQALCNGADAMKLLIYHHPEASPETRRHEAELVEAVGEACADVQLPLILEVVTYPLEGVDDAGAAFARRKPDLVADAAETYSDPRFRVDVLKLEFPADLSFAASYQDAPFAAGTVAYEEEDVEAACRRVDAAAGVPWVILSAGVGIGEFVETLRHANAAGASGFLCGRAVWKDVVEHAPDLKRMRRFVQEEGRARLERLRAVNETARPWTEHPRVQGERQGERRSGEAPVAAE